MTTTDGGPATAELTTDTASGLPLLADKLEIPRPGLRMLRRERLTERIGQAADHRVTLVSGPAGAGKTVACAAWAAGRTARRVAWLTIDPGDREPARFWRYLAAALARACPEQDGALRAQASARPEGTPAALADLARRLHAPVTVVLDDVHELAGSPVLPGLSMLIRHAPATLRVVLSGRCGHGLAGLPLARLRLAGDVADITAGDLACTQGEAEAYFAMLGIPLSEAQRDEVLRVTEGWMAGLRLAVLRAGTAGGQGSLQGAGGRQAGDGPETASRSISGLAGREPLVSEYLRDEILGSEPPETRLFLLRTSVIRQVSGELADVLTGVPGGARTLDRLSKENGLVMTTGPEHAEYRYHPLLRDLLAAELRREIPYEVPVLLRRAARWQAAHGQPVEAVISAAGAQDWDYAAHALAEAGPVELLRDGPDRLEQALASFPSDRLADEAPVAAALAAARLWRSDRIGAAFHLDNAARAVDTCSAPVRRIMLPWLEALRVMDAADGGRADPGLLARAGRLASATEATGRMAEHRSLGLLWFAIGAARVRRWEMGPALDALARAERQLAAGGLATMQARAAGWRAFAEAEFGNLARAERIALALLRDVPQGDTGCLALAKAASAQASLIRDDLAAARRLLDEVDTVPPGRLPGEPDLVVVAGVLRARLRLAVGDLTGARAVLIRLQASLSAADPAVRELRVLLDTAAALRPGAGTGQPGPPGEGPALADADTDVACQRIAGGWLLVASSDFDRAIAAAAPCLDGAEGVTLRHRITARLITAVALRRLGRRSAAADALDEALALAEPDEDYREFLDAGQAVRSSITVLVPPDSPRAGFARRILNRFDSQLALADTVPAGEGPALTHSELAVLRFLPSQMTNQEIAAALFLSTNTVKTHLRSVYRKLGIASRREAIAQGRRLDLL
jgi:LuxR family maltose regulon positive regulatory protein